MNTEKPTLRPLPLPRRRIERERSLISERADFASRAMNSPGFYSLREQRNMACDFVNLTALRWKVYDLDIEYAPVQWIVKSRFCGYSVGPRQGVWL